MYAYAWILCTCAPCARHVRMCRPCAPCRHTINVREFAHLRAACATCAYVRHVWSRAGHVRAFLCKCVHARANGTPCAMHYMCAIHVRACASMRAYVRARSTCSIIHPLAHDVQNMYERAGANMRMCVRRARTARVHMYARAIECVHEKCAKCSLVQSMCVHYCARVRVCACARHVRVVCNAFHVRTRVCHVRTCGPT